MHNKKLDNNKSQNFIQGLRPLSNSMPHGLKKILKKGGYNFSNIVNNWSKMVGKNISNICYPKNIKMNKEMNNGILTLNVMHGNELEVEYSKSEITDKINSFFGYKCIKEIKLRIIKEKIELNKKNNKKKLDEKLLRKVDKINNLNLKKKLNDILKAYEDKKE